MIFLAQSAISFLNVSLRSSPIDVQELVIVLRAVDQGNKVEEDKGMKVEHFQFEKRRGGVFPPRRSPCKVQITKEKPPVLSKSGSMGWRHNRTELNRSDNCPLSPAVG